MGCHFLFQCMKVKSENEVAQLCPTLCDPMDCSPPGSSVHRIFQWGAIAFSFCALFTLNTQSLGLALIGTECPPLSSTGQAACTLLSIEKVGLWSEV